MSLLFQGLFIEFVSDPSNGEDPLGLAIILLHRFSQTADVNIDRSRRHECFSSPDSVEKLISVQHSIGILDEETEQLEFFESQLDRSAADKNFVSGEVN